MKTIEIIYLVKFLLYGGIASYDYATGSKFTLAWAMIAILMLVFLIISEIRDLKEKNN